MPAWTLQTHTRARVHMASGFSGTPGQIHRKPGLLWGWYRRLVEFSTHFTKCLPLNSLLLIFDMIIQQDFCIKMVMVHSGLGRGEGVHILLRGIYAVPFIHRNTNRAFFRLSGADWGGICNISLT